MDDKNVNELSMDILLRLMGDQNTVNLLTAMVAKKMLNTSDVTMLFHVSERTLQRWRKEGRIKSVKVGGRYYYYWEDVVTMMQSKG